MQRERRPLAHFRLHFNPPLVVLDDLFADGKAEAGAFGLVREGIADLPELLEDF